MRLAQRLLPFARGGIKRLRTVIATSPRYHAPNSLQASASLPLRIRDRVAAGSPARMRFGNVIPFRTALGRLGHRQDGHERSGCFLRFGGPRRNKPALIVTDLVRPNCGQGYRSTRLAGNHISPKRSADLRRAPLANSEALTCLRPSSLTDCKRKTLALPQATNQSPFPPNRVPGTPRTAAKEGLTSAGKGASFTAGSPQRWQVWPRNLL